MIETKMCACGNRDGTNPECERCSLIHLREQVADLKVENVRLRKIMCYVPAKIAIKAKEAAGFGNVITLAEMTEECDHEWEVVDDSFDHEFGCEKIVFERCLVCDAEREHEPQHFSDDVI